ncbi:MAG TPA: DUF805 domain-containing protein [Galbitalea sp.]
MSFSEAVQTCLSKYAVWQGRAGRAEFWWFNLLGGLITLVGVITKVFSPTAGNVIFWACAIPLLLPSIAVGIRRLHDTGRSGWHFLWTIVPLVGSLVMLVYLTQPSDPRSNRYGRKAASPVMHEPADWPLAR